MRTSPTCLIAAALVIGLRAEPVSFQKEVAPILARHCQGCHGAAKAKGGFRLDTYAHLQKPGDSGEPSLVAAAPAKSELLRRLTTNKADERMPAEADPLPAAEITLLRRWVEEGAACDGEPTASLEELLPPATHPAAPIHYPSAWPITALALTEGGQEVFVSGYYEITAWRVKDGRLLRRFGNVAERTYGLATHGRWLAAASGAPGLMGEARVFDAFTGELLAVPLRSADVVLCLAFSPDGSRLAVGGSDGKVSLFRAPHFARERVMANHSDWVNAVAWSSDGQRLATAGRDRTVKVVAAASGEILATFHGHLRAVRGVGFTPDGQGLLSVGEDKLVFRWKMGETKSAKPLATLAEPAHGLLAAKEHWVHWGADGALRLRAFGKEKEERVLAGESVWLQAAAFDPLSGRLVSGSQDGQVAAWEVASGQLQHRFAARPLAR